MSPSFTTHAPLGVGALLLAGPEARNTHKVAFASPFASISASLISRLGTATSDGKGRREPHTQMEFPLTFCMNSKPCSQLAAIGVRSKRLLGIKNLHIYAVGVYVDGAAAKKALAHQFKSSETEDLAKNQAMFDSLIAADSVEKTVRLVISFGSLKRTQFLDALEERLVPALKEAGESAVLDQFKDQFNSVEFRRGMEITFTSVGNKLVTKVDGESYGAVTNPAFTSALFNIWLGPDSVSPDTKESLGKTLSATLKG